MENLQKQNTWLKEERSQIQKSNAEHKTKYERESQLHQQAQNKLVILSSKSLLKTEEPRARLRS